MRRAGPGNIKMYICLHNAENRGKSEVPLDKSASVFMQGPSVLLQLIDMVYTKPCCKHWYFYRTSYYDKFRFLFSFPSLSLAWSPSCFLFVVVGYAGLWYASLATLAVASHMPSIPIDTSFGQGPVSLFFAFTSDGWALCSLVLFNSWWSVFCHLHLTEAAVLKMANWISSPTSLAASSVNRWFLFFPLRSKKSILFPHKKLFPISVSPVFSPS